MLEKEVAQSATDFFFSIIIIILFFSPSLLKEVAFYPWLWTLFFLIHNLCCLSMRRRKREAVRLISGKQTSLYFLVGKSTPEMASGPSIVTESRALSSRFRVSLDHPFQR